MKGKSKLLLFMVAGILLISANIPKRAYELPKAKKKDIIHHLAYSLVYNEPVEQAKWVAYELTWEELVKIVSRNDKFISDPMIKTGSAVTDDYKNSGYQRGHLAPANDMLWSDTVMKESFFMSNMSPQLGSLNAGKWKTLENKVRDWVLKYNSVYVAAGPVFTNYNDTIGKDNKIIVPTHFFKVVMVYNDSIQQAIGFIMPHRKIEDELSNYAVSVDSVEIITGIDFFTALPNRKEKKIEKSVDKSFWGL